jgi:hypothetical protein
VPPVGVKKLLGGRIVFSEKRQGQWIAVIEMEKIEMQNAGVGMQK